MVNILILRVCLDIEECAQHGNNLAFLRSMHIVVLFDGKGFSIKPCMHGKKLYFVLLDFMYFAAFVTMLHAVLV